MTFEVHRTCRGASRRSEGGPLTIGVRHLEDLIDWSRIMAGCAYSPHARDPIWFRLELGSWLWTGDE